MVVDLVPLPPAIRMEGQADMREMDPWVCMPAIAETIAHDIGRRATGRSSKAAEGERGAQESFFEGLHRRAPIDGPGRARFVLVDGYFLFFRVCVLLLFERD